MERQDAIDAANALVIKRHTIEFYDATGKYPIATAHVEDGATRIFTRYGEFADHSMQLAVGDELAVRVQRMVAAAHDAGGKG